MSVCSSPPNSESYPDPAMSQIVFENIAAKIAAGTITADEITDYPCASLTSEEKTALLTILADTLVSDATESKLASVQSGEYVGDGGTFDVPAFLVGRMSVVDTDLSATYSLDGTHQSVTDSLGDSYPEGTTMDWSTAAGYHHAGRTFTVPAGITVLYSFLLKD